MEEVEVEVPSHFLCPISLQLMQDPVTVSTGITYDRDSIQHWISATRRKSSPIAGPTCPVTKQPLSATADLTPNHTLRRLIQSWCTLNADRGIDPIPNPAKSPVKAIGILSHIDASEDELKLLMIGEGEELVEQITRILSEGDSHERSSAVKLLMSLYKVADPNQLMMAESQLFSETVRLLNDRVSTHASKWALKLLIELNPWGRNRIKAVDAGATAALVEILLDSPEKRVCELAVVALDQLCGCAEGRAALLGHGAGLAVVSKKILRVSNAVSDRAVRILGSISKYSGNSGAVAEMLQVGVAAKLCLVLQVECSLKTKERAKEILKRHSRVWKNSSCVPPHLLYSYPA